MNNLNFTVDEWDTIKSGLEILSGKGLYGDGMGDPDARDLLEKINNLLPETFKYKEEFDALKQKCVDDFQCQPKELKSLIASKQVELENKLSEINDKIEELQEED